MRLRTSLTIVACGLCGLLVLLSATLNFAQPAKNTPKDAAPVRKTLAGKWILVRQIDLNEFPLALLEIREEKGQPKAELLAAGESFPNPRLLAFSSKDQSVELQFQVEASKVRFAGRFADGMVRGELLIGDTGMSAAWLVPTDADDLVGRRPVPARTAQGLVRAIESEDIEAIQEWLQRNPDSPLALRAYFQALRMLELAEVDAAQADKFAQRYIATAQSWGPTLKLGAQTSTGEIFARSERYRELALPYLDAVAKANAPPFLSMPALTAKVRLLIALGREEEGVELANAVLEKNPLDPDLTLLLAQRAQAAKQTDRAIELYARIVATPLMEGRVFQILREQSNGLAQPSQIPSRTLERLWKAKHGSTEGLEAYLDASYSQAIQVVKPERVAPRKPAEGTRVALVEVFTGQACGPCVAADLGATLLEKAYAPTEVIVLRYHLHKPAPDPLANPENRARWEAAQGEHTPTVTINGVKVGAGAYMEHVAAHFEQFRETVLPVLSQQSDLSIDVTAKSEGGKISFSAKAAGKQPLPKSLRLCVALAEDHVKFKGQNGIRSHEMIVRALPAGVDGVSAREGQLQFAGEIDLAELRAKLTKQLQDVEDEQSFEFDVKPFPFQAFHVVAFIQDDATGEILQAKSVPVAGLAAGREKDASE